MRKYPFTTNSNLRAIGDLSVCFPPTAIHNNTQWFTQHQWENRKAVIIQGPGIVPGLSCKLLNLIHQTRFSDSRNQHSRQ